MWTHGEGERLATGDRQPLRDDLGGASGGDERLRADVWVLALDAPPDRSGVEVSEVVESKRPKRRHRFARRARLCFGRHLHGPTA